MKSIQRNQGGFSLVEILLVLGIIAILAIAAFIIFPQVQSSNRANSELTNITTIAAGTKNLFGSTRDYFTVTTGVVNQARIFPPSMNGNQFGATDEIQSSWNADVAVAPANCATGAVPGAAPARCFSITYDAVPSEVCSKLVPGLIQNFELVTVGGATVATPADVVTACAGADTTVAFISE
jgi:prepilin-type N-terminal cleavage/methylation domain-containing protein